MNKIDIEIPRFNGKILRAVYYSNNINSSAEKIKNVPFVILCHGFSGDKYEWGRFTKTCEKLTENGFDSVIFDFSGSGKNEREFITIKKQVKDLEDVFSWAMNKGYKNISTIGLSFGGLTSLLAQLPERKCAIFWAPAFYMSKIISNIQRLLSKIVFTFRKKPFKIASNNNEHIWINHEFIKQIDSFNVDKYLEDFNTPSLVIQGLEDKTVLAEQTRCAFSLMPKDKHHKLVEIANTGHEFNDEYRDQFISLSIKCLKKYMKK